MRLGGGFKSGAMVAAPFMLLGASLVRAETRVFSCVAGQRSNSAYQPESVQVTVDLGRWLVSVEDDLTGKVQKGPLVGEVDTRKHSRLTVSWVVRGLPSDLKDLSSNFGNATVFQRLTIRPCGDHADQRRDMAPAPQEAAVSDDGHL